MPGITVFEHIEFQVESADEHRDKHELVIALCQFRIHVDGNLSRTHHL